MSGQAHHGAGRPQRVQRSAGLRARPSRAPPRCPGPATRSSSP